MIDYDNGRYVKDDRKGIILLSQFTDDKKDT